MTAELHTQTKVNSQDQNGHKRILIEASKLADDKMDGIKRYVVELLTAISMLDLEETFELDVMIHDEVIPLDHLHKWLLLQEGEEPTESRKFNWQTFLTSLLPPVLLPFIKWLIPSWAARRFLGKEKSDLKVPSLGLSLLNLPLLIVPPVILRLLRKIIPERFMIYLWAKGILQPTAKSVDPAPYDLIHHTLPNNYHYIPETSTPTLVTVHDLSHVSCPEFQTRSNSMSLKMGLDSAVNDGASFLTVSDATRAQLIKEYSLESGRVSTVHNGCRSKHFYSVLDTAVRKQVCDKYHIPDSPYLLALSTIEPRKNLDLTIEAFKRLSYELRNLDLNLVIAGNKGWKSHRVIRVAEVSDRIHLTGYIADEDLAAIYSSARGFLYLSHYEGFGLPLLEAMRCGVPVIYGNNSSMPEIVDDAGLAANSYDIDDIIRQIKRLVFDDELAETLRCRALQRASAFTWDHTAALTLAAYEKYA